MKLTSHTSCANRARKEGNGAWENIDSAKNERFPFASTVPTKQYPCFVQMLAPARKISTMGIVGSSSFKLALGCNLKMPVHEIWRCEQLFLACGVTAPSSRHRYRLKRKTFWKADISLQRFEHTKLSTKPLSTVLRLHNAANALATATPTNP